MNVLKIYYKMEEYWKGELYYGITLIWNYDEGYVDISMPNYVAHMNQIRSDMENILTTSYMKNSPLPSMITTRNSSRKY